MAYTRQNARFWVMWKGGYVKITLKPGQEVMLQERQRTDEGYFNLIEGYALTQGGMVIAKWSEWGADCDGRYERGGEAYCPISQLVSRESYPDGEYRLPEWQREKQHQRDYAAEAVGY